MRKQGKLYTVNKWNQPLFMPKENVFWDGGGVAFDPNMYGLLSDGMTTPKYNNFFNVNTELQKPSFNYSYGFPKSSPINNSLSYNLDYSKSLGYNNNLNLYQRKTPSFNTGNLQLNSTPVVNTTQPTTVNTLSRLDRKAFADYQKNPWNYTQDYQYGNGPTITEQYKTQRNAQRAQTWSNVGNAASSMTGMIPSTEMTIGDKTYKRGLWDAADPVYYFADGRESDVGNALGDAGVWATQNLPGKFKLIGAGLKIAGDITNAAFGTKTDEKKLKEVNQNIANLSNYYSNASSFDDLRTPVYGMVNTDVYDGGFSRRAKKKARRENQELKDRLITATDWADRSYLNNLHNIQDDQKNWALRNYSAWGGPLTYMAMNNNNGMSAIDYGFMSDYLASKNKQADAKDTSISSNMFAGVSPSIFAKGGKKDRYASSRKIIESYAKGRVGGGGNPLQPIGDYLNSSLYGGVYEGGHFGGAGAGSENFFIPTRDSIVSDTMFIPYRQTFNDAFRQASNNKQDNFMFNGKLYKVEYGDNPDNYEAGLKRVEEGILPIVIDKHVKVPDIDNNELKAGGKIHIKPSHRGRLTELKKRTGKTEAELYRIGSPATRKMITFARNARKWKHDLGGPLYIDSLVQPASFGEGLLDVAPQDTMFALGGDLQMHGGDYSSGLVHVDAGNSHELNPYQGVQMGVDNEGIPNLVEENEVVYNDYVYSMRIPIDDTTKEHFHISKKKDMTYAELAKMLEKKNEVNEKPNDAIAQAGFASQMSQLADDQERQKAEMEAERARQAFEALSPEEQTAIMQRAAQEEQMTQEAAAQQQMQQVPTEEEVLAQQMADGSEAQVAPIQAACGGKINRFDDGGELKKRVYSILGLHTDSEFRKWAKENLASEDVNWDTVPLKETTFKPLIGRDSFKKAIAKDNPALADALSKGYDFGINQPTANGKATIQSINKGNWNATDGAGWLGSEDLAFKQATEGLTEDEIKALTTEQLAQRMQATEAYKNTSKWLENSDNALLYLNTLLNDAETPEVAKKHARQFVKDGRWINPDNYSYDKVFGKVRTTNPGTYWHTAMEANRGNQSQNWVINDDGTIEEIIGEVPEGWTSAGNYTWAGPENNMAYSYYKRPAVASVTETPEETVVETETGDREPLHRWEGWRYAGLFGPAVGLGLMAAGVGKPDYSGIDAAVAIGNSGVRTANWKPIGNYLRYTPMDIWAEQNRLDANTRATDRAIMNSVSPSKYAGLLANAYNSQLASGELYRKALEYNDAKRAQVAEFNRGTDQYNSQAYNQNQQFNADAYNRNRQFGAQLAMNAAQQKLAGDAAWYNSLYGNIGGLFRGLSDLGTENARLNMASALAADGYTNLGDSYTGDMFLNKDKKKKNSGHV